MSSRATLSSVSRQLQGGINGHELSVSYPAPAGYLEARKLARMAKEQQQDPEVIPEGPADGGGGPDRRRPDREGNGGLVGRCTRLLARRLDLATDTAPPALGDTDEVDGRVERTLAPLVKLVFLKIILVDLFISAGDVATDVLLGVHLIVDSVYSLRWDSLKCGLMVLSVPWLPGLLAFMHILSFHRGQTFFTGAKNRAVNALAMACLIVFYPLIPSVLYIKILLAKRRFASNREKLRHLDLEAKTHELRSIAGAVQSPVQAALLVWMALRGTVAPPWEDRSSVSCLRDSLGRIACLPSLPVVSFAFSLLSMLKACLDLNVFPLFSNNSNEVARGRQAWDMTFKLTPFLAVTVWFRTVSAGFIVAYIDYWSAIPGILLLLISYVAVCMSCFRGGPELGTFGIFEYFHK